MISDNNRMIKVSDMYNSATMDEPISIETAQGKFYYLFDGLGSVTGLTDVGGNLVSTYSYDAFGLMMLYLTEQGPIAGWRDSNQDFNTGQTLKVEEFGRWVYVYGDQTLIGTGLYEVHYVGDNMYYTLEDMYKWPGGTETYLPLGMGWSNSVKQAWEWKETSTSSESATRSEYYEYSYD